MTLPEIELEMGLAPRVGRSLSIDETAQLLGVSRRTIYYRISDGRLRTVRTLGASQRVLVDSMQNFRGPVAGKNRRS